MFLVNCVIQPLLPVRFGSAPSLGVERFWRTPVELRFKGMVPLQQAGFVLPWLQYILCEMFNPDLEKFRFRSIGSLENGSMQFRFTLSVSGKTVLRRFRFPVPCFEFLSHPGYCPQPKSWPKFDAKISKFETKFHEFYPLKTRASLLEICRKLSWKMTKMALPLTCDQRWPATEIRKTPKSRKYENTLRQKIGSFLNLLGPILNPDWVP